MLGRKEGNNVVQRSQFALSSDLVFRTEWRSVACSFPIDQPSLRQSTQKFGILFSTRYLASIQIRIDGRMERTCA